MNWNVSIQRKFRDMRCTSPELFAFGRESGRRSATTIFLCSPNFNLTKDRQHSSAEIFGMRGRQDTYCRILTPSRRSIGATNEEPYAHIVSRLQLVARVQPHDCTGSKGDLTDVKTGTG
jgi:hypothetical protein